MPFPRSSPAWMLTLLGALWSLGCARHARPVHTHELPSSTQSRLQLAWSSDGARVAWVDAARAWVLPLGEAEPRELKIAAPVDVAFDEDGALLVLDERGTLHRFGDSARPAAGIQVVPELGTKLVDIASIGRNAFLVAHHDVEVTSFGTTARSGIGISTQGAVTWLHDYSVVFPKGSALPYGYGAATLGPEHPRRATWLVSEFHAPPRFPAYHRVFELDPGTGEMSILVELPAGQSVLHFDWAPDGKMAVFGGTNGMVMLFDEATRAVTAVPTEARGLFPSFSPDGEHLFVGGQLITRNGAVVETLDDSGLGSRGWFSPTGNAIAIQDPRGRLRILTFDVPLAEKLAPNSNASELAGKVRRLQLLLRQELITIDDYRSRKNALLSQSETAP